LLIIIAREYREFALGTREFRERIGKIRVCRGSLRLSYSRARALVTDLAITRNPPKASNALQRHAVERSEGARRVVEWGGGGGRSGESPGRISPPTVSQEEERLSRVGDSISPPRARKLSSEEVSAARSHVRRVRVLPWEIASGGRDIIKEDLCRAGKGALPRIPRLFSGS
jgi:hypothetical protein